jgi:hypothetical protein
MLRLIFFSVSSSKRRMYVLYQAAIIWVLPVFSTIGKKNEKKVSPPISPFFGGQKVEQFFSPFLDPLPVYEFL